jgi:hypothetical protein
MSYFFDLSDDSLPTPSADFNQHGGYSTAHLSQDVIDLYDSDDSSTTSREKGSNRRYPEVVLTGGQPRKKNRAEQQVPSVHQQQQSEQRQPREKFSELLFAVLSRLGGDPVRRQLPPLYRPTHFRFSVIGREEAQQSARLARAKR